MRDPFSSKRGKRPVDPEPMAEVDDELTFHLEQRVRDYIARGMDPVAARAAALQRLGNLSDVRDECTELLVADRRAAAHRDWLGDLRQDLRFGIRGAARAPLFSLLAIVTLALGIGANTAIFGVVKSVLLDALPYADADRVVRVYGRLLDGTGDRGPLSAGTITDIATRQRSFSGLAAFRGLPYNLAYVGEDGPRVVTTVDVEPAFFAILGVRPALGRTLSDADTAARAPAVVMLTHSTWERLFASDPSVIGRSLRIDGVPRTVIGVLPRGFVGPLGEAGFYLPLELRSTLSDPVRTRRRQWLGAVARLKSDVAVDAAQREASAIAADLARRYPEDNGSFGVTVMPVRDAMIGSTRTPLLVLMGSAGLVLLIACANLAGALLSRAISRRKEFAVRVALGAGRGRLIRQLLTESIVLALAGGAAGLLLAGLGLSVVRALAVPALPDYAELSLDSGAMLFTTLLALCTGLAFGVAPALSVSRADPQGALRDESRGTSEGRRSRRLRGVLVAGQIALCVSLLAGAGLLTRSLWAIADAPLGFRPESVLGVTVQLPPGDYATGQSRVRFMKDFEARVSALPGVIAVASTSDVPTRVMNRVGFSIVGAPPVPSDALPFVLYTGVSDDYFRTLGIALVSGRTFAADTRPREQPGVIVSESMARRYWPDGKAIGSRIRMGPDPASPWTPEVVGIVADVRNDPARAEPEAQLYVSNREDPWGGSAFVIRTRVDPNSLINPVRRELAAIDPRLPIDDASSLSAMLSESLVGRKLPVVLMAAFGALALLLASVGVYAMFAAMAAAREREFSVRLALGSSRRGIARLVLRQGGVWMALGLAGGAVGVVIVTRALRGLLYGVSQFDPVALGIAVLALLVCGAVALLIPVRRATRVDPITVLR